MHTRLAYVLAVFAIFLLKPALTLPIKEGEDSPVQLRERRAVNYLGDLTAGETGVISEKQTLIASQRNCKELYDEGQRTSGVYTINPKDKGPTDKIEVFCDMTLDPEGDGKHGWLVIQRRVDDTVQFNRSRSDYEYGFGLLAGSFWLGLDNIKRILDGGSDGYELYIGMGRHGSSATRYAKWDSFSLGTKASDWTLSVSGFSASPGVSDSLAVSNGKKFSTQDRDSDSSSGNCAAQFKGGWWYNNCHEANPNGYYYPTSDNVADYNGVLYTGWLGKAYSLKTIVMLIRPK